MIHAKIKQLLGTVVICESYTQFKNVRPLLGENVAFLGHAPDNYPLYLTFERLTGGADKALMIPREFSPENHNNKVVWSMSQFRNFLIKEVKNDAKA